MTGQRAPATWTDFLAGSLDLQRDGPSLQGQLLRHLRARILDGRLAPGSLLPGSRQLATLVGVSRNTVTAVYELLGAEGYIEAGRSGTRVADLRRPPSAAPAMRVAQAPALSLRAMRIPRRAAVSGDGFALRPGVPALDRFPLAAWKRCVDAAMTRHGNAALGHGDPWGEPELRAAILHHVALARGVRATPEQVVITRGAQEALSLCVRLLTDIGDTAWIEEPGYRGAQDAMAAGGVEVVGLPVDESGLVIADVAWSERTPKLVYTTPSHQYPLGTVLSAARRLALLRDASTHGAWIVEDDYDSEFRRSGESIGAMQGLVPDAPVLYVGSFSKTMFPALRMGFLIVPPALLSAMKPVLGELLRGGRRFEQLAMADFIRSGRFGRHVAAMRRLYRERRDALRDALEKHLRVPHTVTGGDSGMHLALHLPAAVPDRRVAFLAREHGMAPEALSAFAAASTPAHHGLVLGYGNTDASRMGTLIATLSTLIERTLTDDRR